MPEARQIAIVLYPGLTALDALGPYEVLKYLSGAEIRFVAHEPGPVAIDRAALTIGATHSFDETSTPFMLLVPGSEANTTTAMADRGRDRACSRTRVRRGNLPDRSGREGRSRN